MQVAQQPINYPMQEESLQYTPNKAHEKMLKVNRMNDTYAQWKQIPKKKTHHKSHPQEPFKFASSNDLPLSTRIQDKLKKNDVKGLTLDEYFRAKSQIELEVQITKINEQDQQQINKYCNEEFEKEATWENEQNFSKKVQTPEFNHIPQAKQKQGRKKSHNKQNIRSNKLKTQSNEGQSLTKTKFKSKNKQKNKKHLPTAVDQEEQYAPMLDTFYKAVRKNNKIQYDAKICKKNKMLDKVQQQKERLAQFQASDISFVTKHALKFNINKNICRQLIMDERRS